MNSKLLIKLLQNLPPKLIESFSLKIRDRTLKNAIKTRAYKNLLKTNNINLKDLDFNKLPITDKHSYITPNSLKDLIAYPIKEHYTIEMSSGHSGQPLYWPRFKGQDDNFLNYMEMGLIFTYHIDKVPTLFLNTFALGTWVTGVKLAKFSLELANKKNNELITINTGTNFEDAIKVLKDIGPLYSQIIIAGYPPFISTIVKKLHKTETNSLMSKIRIMAGGEAFSESWRENINTLLGKKNNYTKIFSAYGSADTGLEIGYEQPITVLLRKLLEDNHKLKESILGTNYDYTPHFFQYNPLNVYIQEFKGELIFTSNVGIPLVKYNLHDAGGLLSFNKMIEILKNKYNTKNLIRALKPLRLPCCYVFGRSDGTISIDGANIYVEEIKQALDDYESIKFYAQKTFTNINDAMAIIPFEKVAKSLLKQPIADYKLIDEIVSFSFSTENNSLVFVIYVNNSFNKKLYSRLETLLQKILPIMLYKYCKGYQALVEEKLDSSIISVLIANSINTNKIKNNYLIK